MTSGTLTLALTAVLSGGPYDMHYGGGPAYYGGAPAPGPGPVVVDGSYGAGFAGTPVGMGVTSEQLYPYDHQDMWLHGYFREMPAYGGHARFRPYNYKHVFAQSRTAGGWGLSPNLPYSQQFWHRYHQEATMRQELMSSQGAPHQSPQSRYSTPLRVRQPLAAPPAYGRPAYDRRRIQQAGARYGR